MKISRNEVEYVAGLARLSLQDDEIDALTSDMDSILAYVEKLNELETDGIIPMAHAVPVENAFRGDEVRPSLGTEKALRNAPENENGCFRVPKVIE